MSTFNELTGDMDEQDDVFSEDDMHIKQKDIVARAAVSSGLSKTVMNTAFNALWDEICASLEDGVPVKLHGKGTFYLSKRSSRVGRNPQTKEEHIVPAHEAMAFKPSGAYLKRLRKIRPVPADDM